MLAASNLGFIHREVPPPADLFITSGQSNAGDGNSLSRGDLPSNLLPVDTGVFYWNGSAFVNVTNGINNNPLSPEGPSQDLDNWGPVLEFARQWRLANPQPMYIVNFCEIATTLGGATNSWNPANSGQLFDQMTGYVTAAKAALGNYAVRGLLWMQGEQDAGDSTLAAAYGTNLTAFLAKVRTTWCDVNTKIMIGEISTWSGFVDPAPVRAAQVAAADGVTTFTINTDAFPRQSSNTAVHYTGPGQVDLGSAMFAVY